MYDKFPQWDFRLKSCCLKVLKKNEGKRLFLIDITSFKDQITTTFLCLPSELLSSSLALEKERQRTLRVYIDQVLLPVIILELLSPNAKTAGRQRQ